MKDIGIEEESENRRCSQEYVTWKVEAESEPETLDDCRISKRSL